MATGSEILLRIPDTKRLLQAGLRNHDPETVAAAENDLKAMLGEQLADIYVFRTITNMMLKEGWSFQKSDGTPSPLI